MALPSMRAPLPCTALARFIAERFARYESKPAPSLPTPSAIGKYGENVAASFLRRHGYKVLCRNFSVEEGEIDLVCRHRDVLVFVEVRTRAGHQFGRPIETIDSRKEDALRSAAEAYLRLLEKRDIYHRFDAVEVTWREGKRPVCLLSTNIFT